MEKSNTINQYKYLKIFHGLMWEIERLYDRTDVTFLNKQNIKGVE
jgi:hypothetical protein